MNDDLKRQEQKTNEKETIIGTVEMMMFQLIDIPIEDEFESKLTALRSYLGEQDLPYMRKYLEYHIKEKEN